MSAAQGQGLNGKIPLSSLYRVLKEEVRKSLRLCDALGCKKPATRSGNTSKLRLIYRCEEHAEPQLGDTYMARVVRIMDDIDAQEKADAELQEKGR